MNTDHLNALELRLSHERARLANARTGDERKLRQVWVAQYEKEIAAELKHLGMSEPVERDMTDDELLAALQS